MSFVSLIAQAKERLTIADVWHHLGLPGEPRKSCRSPFRDDRTPSFSVHSNGQKWKDHATGDGGDAIDFWAAATQRPEREVIPEFLKLAGIDPEPRPKKRRDTEDEERRRKRDTWPAFDRPTTTELRQISTLRGLSIEGLELALEAGQLFTADSREGRVWIITDSRRRNAQARRMDGQPFTRGMKSKTLPGSEAALPIGIEGARDLPGIALLEGGPDLLAAWHLIWLHRREDRIAPVAMFGASNRIPDSELPKFKGKRIRIFGHADDAGAQAVGRWGNQLATVAAHVDAWGFAGFTTHDDRAVNDLNDFVHVNADQWERERTKIESIFDFAGKGVA